MFQTIRCPGRNTTSYILLCLVLSFALAACSGGSTSQQTSGGGGGGGNGGGGGGGGGGVITYHSYGGEPDQPPKRQVDPTAPDNANRDTDCDGLSDAEEIATVYSGANGAQNTTDPANPDTDNDGLPDGLELGRTQMIEPTRCAAYFVATNPYGRPDTDPTTTTNPVDADSDDDGVMDGVEDLNQNGRVDPGEGDPNNPNQQGTAVVTAACSDANLATVQFDRSQYSDVQMATLGFTERQLVKIGSNNADEKGWLYWDSINQIAAFALKMEAVAATVTDMETAGLAAFTAEGAVANPIKQVSTTWDGYNSMRATYRWAATDDAKTLANSIAIFFAGAGATGWSGVAGVTAPSGWLLRVEYVRRSGGAGYIVGAFTPDLGDTSDTALKMDDVVNGSAFAQSDDTSGVKCNTFQTLAYSKIDILWVVDNSGSMDIHQAAVKVAGDAMAQVLASSPVDWRMGLVTTSYYYPGARVSGRDLKDFTNDINTVKTWFDKWPAWTSSTQYEIGDRASTDYQFSDNYVCTIAGTSAPSGVGPYGQYTNDVTDGTVHWRYDSAWVGTSGYGDAEAGFESVKAALTNYFLNQATPAAKRLRSDAKLVIIVLSDTEEQGNQAAPIWAAYFNQQNAQVNGIVCQRDQCSESEDKSQKYIDVVNGMGGILASIDEFDGADQTKAEATLRQMIWNATGATSPYKLPQTPISSSLKVALEGPTVGSSCNLSNVPRSRSNGFDYDATANSVLFYGDCRPNQTGKQIALSYRYWVPGNCPPEGCFVGCDPPCPANMYCQEQNGSYACVCSADCGGTCTGEEYCNMQTCSCVGENW